MTYQGLAEYPFNQFFFDLGIYKVDSKKSNAILAAHKVQ